jgi:hypothetical protein
MKSSDEDDGKKGGGKSSGGTRRIVVQDLPPEEAPQVRGRRLTTPVELEQPTRPRTPLQSAPNTTQRVSTAKTQPNIRRTMPVAPPHVVAQKRPASQVNFKRLLLLLGVIIFVPFVLVVIVLLLPKPKQKVAIDSGTASVSAPSPVSEPQATASVQASPPEGVAPTESPETGSPVVNAEDVRSMTVQLASQISQKSGYEFAPEFVELIRSRTAEYINEKALISARLYRREINKSFRDEGLNPLVGYALAMSRSKFDPAVTDKGIGIWQVPIGVARSQGYVGSSENPAKLKVPETSAQITASYTKQLLTAFDAEDFMYAIACFGMSLQEAGRLQGQLVRAAPDSKTRRNIMNMIRAGVLTSDQVDNIARFLAAGIVGENPKKFGLDNSESFSSMY